MARLINTQYPFLRILVDAPLNDKGKPGAVYRKFEAGLLEIDESDPFYEKVMAWAAKDPFTSIHLSSAKGDEPAVERQAKERAANVCDICIPAQSFESPEALADHAALLHAAAPTEREMGGRDEPAPVATVKVRQGPGKAGG